MILRELGDYLAAQQKVSRRDLARHFHTSEDAVEAMLGVWMRKGESSSGRTGSAAAAAAARVKR